MQGRIYLGLATKKEEEGGREGREGERKEEGLKCISFTLRDMHITQWLGRETQFILKKPTTCDQGTPPDTVPEPEQRHVFRRECPHSVSTQGQGGVLPHTPGTNGRVHTAETTVCTTKLSSRYIVIQSHCLHTHTHLRAVYNLLT